MAKMTSRQLANELKSRLTNDSWSHQFNREKDTLRIEDKQTGKGITLELPPIIAKWEVKPDETLDEIVYYVKEALNAMKGEAQKTSQEKKSKFIRSFDPLPFPRHQVTRFRSFLMSIQLKRESTMHLTLEAPTG